MNAIIEVENLNFGYTPQNTILKDISFEVIQGRFLAIAGPNGAGKTTLLNLLCGLLRPKAGSIRIDAAPVESYSVKKLAQKVAVVRQEFVPVFDFTVAQMVSMARTPYLGTFGFETKADKQMINEALEATDTAQFALRPLGSLSGGERQRVFIARALAANSPVLLLDEPTTFLDLKHQVGIYDLLKAAQFEKGKTIVAVTHDINLAAQYCDEILLLGADGNYHIGETKDVLSQEQIEKVFGVRTFVGSLGQEKFFIPLGKFAKDSGQITRKPHNIQQE
ncbi:MAG: ABC transporter ATP-binding protein [Planctomycetes bacterium]|nr:ABC transporter ATP-binding protein [Planctomycetota bacterium]MCH8118650.1 ABC transporter ATP-binding protein [Planctomycetota bacterium]